MEPGAYDPSSPRALHRRVTQLEVKVEMLCNATDTSWPHALKVSSFWACVAVCVIAITKCAASR